MTNAERVRGKKGKHVGPRCVVQRNEWVVAACEIPGRPAGHTIRHKQEKETRPQRRLCSVIGEKTIGQGETTKRAAVGNARRERKGKIGREALVPAHGVILLGFESQGMVTGRYR